MAKDDFYLVLKRSVFVSPSIEDLKIKTMPFSYGTLVSTYCLVPSIILIRNPNGIIIIGCRYLDWCYGSKFHSSYHTYFE